MPLPYLNKQKNSSFLYKKKELLGRHHALLLLHINLFNKGIVMGVVVALTAVGRTVSPLWRKYIIMLFLSVPHNRHNLLL